MVGSRYISARAFALLVLPFVTACGGATRSGPDEGTGGTATATGGAPAVLSAKDYDQSCAVDADCALVTEGPRCSCGCPNATINVGDVPLWKRAIGSCPPMTCPEVVCEDVVPSCPDGLCTLRRSQYIDPDAFDRTCLTNTDCVLISTGEYCSGCSCARAGVSKYGYEEYVRLTATFERCNPEPIQCECAVPVGAVCVPQPNGAIGRCDAAY